LCCLTVGRDNTSTLHSRKLPSCSGVTMVLQWCHNGVSILLQWCYSAA
jgi:hypothetical protein